jgi:Pvc16 N-terminal domain
MSSDLAIAGVTATLRFLLQQGVVDHAKLGAQGPVTVTAKAPDLIDTESSQLADQINLYMYHVAPNSGWRNANLPSRDSFGARIDNPPLALDLYYIITAYSQQELYADVLLGYAMQFLHEVPVLTQSAIRSALAPPPPEVTFISPDDLLNQIEQIKISPYALDADEMYKIWMAFQTTYRPSAAYHVSVVLIENPRAASSALPVLTIGSVDVVTHRPAGVLVNPNMLPTSPMLTAVSPPNPPAVRLGDTLSLTGFHLADGPVTATLTNVVTAEAVTISAAVATDTSLDVPLPPPATAPDALRAGAYSVRAMVGTGTDTRTTNSLPLALAPLIQNMSTAGPPAQTVLTLQCAPKVWPGQRISALIGDFEIFPDAWAGPSTDTLHFTFDATPFAPGLAKPWIRLRIDGIDSLLVNQGVDPPQFDPTQVVPL